MSRVGLFGFRRRLLRTLLLDLKMIFLEEGGFLQVLHGVHRVKKKQLLDASVIGIEATLPWPKLKQARILIVSVEHNVIFIKELAYNL